MHVPVPHCSEQTQPPFSVTLSCPHVQPCPSSSSHRLHHQHPRPHCYRWTRERPVSLLGQGSDARQLSPSHPFSPITHCVLPTGNQTTVSLCLSSGFCCSYNEVWLCRVLCHSPLHPSLSSQAFFLLLGSSNSPVITAGRAVPWDLEQIRPPENLWPLLAWLTK